MVRSLLSWSGLMMTGASSRPGIEKTLVHANDRFGMIGPQTDSAEQAGALKQFLKVETERLKMQHRSGTDGLEVAGLRSYLVDLAINHACRFISSNGMLSDSFAVIAIGGYGRQELSPCSDVDVLLLHSGKAKQARALAEQLLYLMWDAGLTVGHSFRSIDECVTMARDDLHSRTALCSARLVKGSIHLLRKLNQELERRVFSDGKAATAFIDRLQTELLAGYSRFGPSVCMQEPNLKDGPGGLRSLHAVLWSGHARFGLKTLGELSEQGHVSIGEYGAAQKAYEFLMRVRNESHFQAGRKADLLTLEAQGPISEMLGYKQSRGLLPSEVFMRDYYRRASELYEFSLDFMKRMQAMKAQGKGKASAQSAGKKVAGLEARSDGFYIVLRPGTGPDNLPEGFAVVNGEVHYGGSVQDFLKQPLLVLEAIKIAQTRSVPLSRELKRAINSVLPVAGPRLARSREAASIFLGILSCKGRVASAVRLMRECGILGRFLPEFARITFLVQHDFYHRYTIDEHSLKAVEAVDELLAASDEKLGPMRAALERLANPADLYLAVLLHDTGKGRGGGHVERGGCIAEKAARRLGLSPESASTVVFLVSNHLLMSHLSQRRDLTDDHLIHQFVASVGSVERLDLLLLLTYADISGVGPGIWNNWKASLLLELYDRARERFSNKEPGSDLNEVNWPEVLAPHVEGPSDPDEFEQHLAIMPRRYLRATNPEDVARHVELIRGLHSKAVTFSWRTLAPQHCTELTIVTRDRPGLFAGIAGTLTAHSLNILSADLYTRADGVVLDTFKICEVASLRPLRQELWSRIETNLAGAFSGSFDVRAAFEKWSARERFRAKKSRRHIRQAKVSFDQSSSAAATVMEVRSEDEPGVAYKIADRIAMLGLSIQFAKISSEKGQVLDVFYLTDAAGGKLPNDSLSEVEQAVLAALSGQSETVREAV